MGALLVYIICVLNFNQILTVSMQHPKHLPIFSRDRYLSIIGRMHSISNEDFLKNLNQR